MRFSLWIPVALVVLFGLMGSVYIVNEGKTAIVLNLGRVVRSDIGPGLHFKVPLIESVRIFDTRLEVLPAEPERILTSELKDVSVDFFAVGQIKDTRAFWRATSGDETAAVDRLAPLIVDALRKEINARTLSEVVSGERSKIAAAQLETINKNAATLGVQILDLRMKQIDLPSGGKVIEDVYRRMRAEREQQASKLRAEGAEQANQIRAQADADSQIIIAEAERDAQKLRGEGDAEAARLYGVAANGDPGFFAFQRSLEAYRESFKGGDSVIVLDKNDPFLQYMRSDR